MYRITFSPEAEADLSKLKRNEPANYKKAVKLLNELVEHPKTGTGHPEQLKGMPTNRWSRKISKKHRLVYRIYETEIMVDVLSSYGHYEDKKGRDLRCWEGFLGSRNEIYRKVEIKQ